MEIVADTNQYIDFTTTNTDYKGRITYVSTNNGLKLQVNGSSATSLTLNNTTLTTNCIACAGTTRLQSTYAAQGVYMASTATCIKLNGPNGSYTYFTKRCLHITPLLIIVIHLVRWVYVDSSATKILARATTGIRIIGTVSQTSDKRLNLMKITNALDAVKQIRTS